MQRQYFHSTASKLMYRGFLFLICLCLFTSFALQHSSVTHAASFSKLSPAQASIPNDATIAIQSVANSNWVTAEIGWTGTSYGLLRARSSSIGPWETYYLRGLLGCNDTVSFQSADNNLYVSAEIGWTGDNYGLLRARSSSIGPWEKFRVVCLAADFAFQSTANNLYVSAEIGWTGNAYGLLRARSSSPGRWETFGIALR